MADIDPFKVPPLIEFENCVTHDEIIATIQEYLKYYNVIPKWKFVQRKKLSLVISVLESMDYHIHKKQDMYGGKHEEIS